MILPYIHNSDSNHVIDWLEYRTKNDQPIRRREQDMQAIIERRSPICHALPTAMTFCIVLFMIALMSMVNPRPAWGQNSERIQLVGFSYPPFYQVKNGTATGIAVDLAKELFSRLDRQYALSIYPLKRTLSMLENGQADCVIILIKTPQRQKFLRFTEPIVTARGLIWSSTERAKRPIHFETLQDLRRYKIGITRGYSYGQEFDNFLQSMNVETANSDYSNLLKLLEHRIDIFPGNELVVQSLINQHPELRNKFLRSSKTFFEWDLRIAISRKSHLVEHLPEIEAVLADLKREGVVDEIIQSYLQ